MILVTVGTNEAPFDRLLQAVEDVGLGDELMVQHGPSMIRPEGATCADYMSYEELTDAILWSEAVITHAGVGSVLTALLNGRRPIVVPRLERYGEAVDDHQVGFGRKLATTGLAELVEDLSLLRPTLKALRQAPPPPPRPEPAFVEGLRGSLTTLVSGSPSYSM